MCQITLHEGPRSLSFGDVIDYWITNAAFGTFFGSVLSDVPVDALFWESPAITAPTLDRPYECVAVDSPALRPITPDRGPFQTAFANAGSGETVVAFDNLGGDARLIAPCPLGPEAGYAHVLAFLRQAPAAQCQALFQTLGQEIRRRLNDQPLWVSTSGLGVYWLHVRLDARPKYYTYHPYKTGRCGGGTGARRLRAFTTTMPGSRH